MGGCAFVSLRVYLCLCVQCVCTCACVLPCLITQRLTPALFHKNPRSTSRGSLIAHQPYENVCAKYIMCGMEVLCCGVCFCMLLHRILFQPALMDCLSSRGGGGTAGAWPGGEVEQVQRHPEHDEPPALLSKPCVWHMACLTSFELCAVQAPMVIQSPRHSHAQARSITPSHVNPNRPNI